ncbi:MAG: hypothetical protein JW791_01175 [Nanoarchaeota archaeon]|nr:hypothetical protein [Nanoarchaeota archaeon]
MTTNLAPINKWGLFLVKKHKAEIQSLINYGSNQIIVAVLDGAKYAVPEEMHNQIIGTVDYIHSLLNPSPYFNLQYVIPVVTKTDIPLAYDCGCIFESGACDLPTFLKSAQSRKIPNIETILEGVKPKLVPTEMKEVFNPVILDDGSQHTPIVLDTLLHSRYSIPVGEVNLQDSLKTALENISYWHNSGEITLKNVSDGKPSVIFVSQNKGAGKKRLVHTVFSTDNILGAGVGGQRKFHFMHKDVVKGSSILIAAYDGYMAYTGNVAPNDKNYDDLKGVDPASIPMVLINGLASYLNNTLKDDPNLKNLQVIIPVATKIDLPLAIEMGHVIQSGNKTYPNIDGFLAEINELFPIQENRKKYNNEQLAYMEKLEKILYEKIMPRVVPVELEHVFPKFTCMEDNKEVSWMPKIFKTCPSSIYDIQLKSLNLKNVVLTYLGEILKMDSVGEITLENLDMYGSPKISVASHKGSVGKTQILSILSTGNPVDEKEIKMTIGAEQFKISKNFLGNHTLDDN